MTRALLIAGGAAFTGCLAAVVLAPPAVATWAAITAAALIAAGAVALAHWKDTP